MRYVFLCAHRIQGIAHGADAPDVVLLEQEHPWPRVVLTRRLKELWTRIDQQGALRGVMGQSLPSTSAPFRQKIPRKAACPRCAGGKGKRNSGRAGVLRTDVPSIRLSVGPMLAGSAGRCGATPVPY